VEETESFFNCAVPLKSFEVSEHVNTPEKLESTSSETGFICRTNSAKYIDTRGSYIVAPEAWLVDHLSPVPSLVTFFSSKNKPQRTSNWFQPSKILKQQDSSRYNAQSFLDMPFALLFTNQGMQVKLVTNISGTSVVMQLLCRQPSSL
jgi:hypothetical protein